MWPVLSRPGVSWDASGLELGFAVDIVTAEPSSFPHPEWPDLGNPMLCVWGGRGGGGVAFPKWF